MAKKRNRDSQRDVSTVASSSAVYRVSRSKPVLVSDRRLYHPLGDVAPVFAPKRSQKRIVENVAVRHPRNGNKKVQFSKRSRRYKFSFAVPKKVELCVRRKQRREVLFAVRRTGKGARSVRRRRNYWSGVTCR